MRITNFKKEANLLNDTAKITLEIWVPRPLDHAGFDVFPDKLLPDLLLALSRKYKIKKGELRESDLL